MSAQDRFYELEEKKEKKIETDMFCFVSKLSVII